MRRTDRYRYPVIMTLLILLQFTVRSRLGGDRIAPDFLLLALLIYTIRAEPGRSAAVGFFAGLLRDALTPASFGAGALAHTLVGFFSSWAKAVFFAEHVFVKGCLFFAGTWLRNLIVLLVSGRLQRAPVAQRARRGVAYGRSGRGRAEHVAGDTVSLLPGPEANLRSTLARIASMGNIGSAEIERVLQRARRAPYQPALVLADAPFTVV